MTYTLAIAALKILSPLAYAVDDIFEAIETVGGDHGVSFTNNDVGTITFTIMDSLVPLLNVVAVLIIVIAGLTLLVSQDEGQMSKAQKTLIAALSALVLVNLADAFFNVLRGGFDGATGAAAGAGLFATEISGLLGFIETPLVLIAIITIIVSGIRSILTFGSDQGAAQIRKTVLAVLGGVTLIAFKLIITAATGTTPEDASGITGGDINDSTELARLIADILTIVISFVGLAALVVIVIGGIYMVMNKGDQEVVTKTRNLIIRVVLGLVVILVSVGLVRVFTPTLFGGP